MSDESIQTAKLPAGVTLEKPGPEPKRSTKDQGGIRIPGIPQVDYDPGLPRIINPHYTNNKKSELSCVLMRPDGQCMVERGIIKDDQNPLWRDIRSQFSDEEIELNTQREVVVRNSLSKAADQVATEQKRLKRREDLWSHKTAYLDMDVVKTTKHKMLKRKLRQATTPEEAQAYGIAIIIKEYDDPTVTDSGA